MKTIRSCFIVMVSFFSLQASAATTPTLTLTPSINPVPYNGSVGLRWTSTNTTECYYNGTAVGVVGYVTIPHIKNPITITGSCEGLGSWVIETITIRLQKPVIRITYEPQPVPYGGTASITWQSYLSTECLYGDVPLELSGSIDVPNLIDDLPVSISCTGHGGMTVASATIEVSPPEPEIVQLTAVPAIVPYEGETVISWNTIHTVSCEGNGISVDTSGSLTVEDVTADIPITIRCLGVNGEYISKDLLIESNDTLVQPICTDIDRDDDKDGIPDCAEQYGQTFNGMPLYDWGARTDCTDIFVEIDYVKPFEDEDRDDGTAFINHGGQPKREALDKVRSVFGRQGYCLHFDVGDLYDQSPGLDPDDYDLGGGDGLTFGTFFATTDAPTSDRFSELRKRAFYYARFYKKSLRWNLAGYAEDFLDYYLAVTTANTYWGLRDDTVENRNILINAQAYVLMHELGHLLGLSHGGHVAYGRDAYKPNYPSVMSYFHFFSPIPNSNDPDSKSIMIKDRYEAMRCDESPGPISELFKEDWYSVHLDFSPGNESVIDENNLVEADVYGGIDFNCNGIIESEPQSFDASHDGNVRKLYDYDDWNNLHLYYRHLNYKDGIFLPVPNPDVLEAKHPYYDDSDLSESILNAASELSVQDLEGGWCSVGIFSQPIDSGEGSPSSNRQTEDSL